LEVGKRIMAGPGDEDYGVLSLLVQLNYQPQDSFRIPASCFFPEPDVDSACVSMVRRSEPMLTSETKDLFGKVVKRSFSQRRKMMLKLLKQDWPEETLENVFQAVGLSPQTRAEQVSADQFAQLVNFLAAKNR